jgi:hypothetical protein
MIELEGEGQRYRLLFHIGGHVKMIFTLLAQVISLQVGECN